MQITGIAIGSNSSDYKVLFKAQMLWANILGLP